MSDKNLLDQNLYDFFMKISKEMTETRGELLAMRKYVNGFKDLLKRHSEGHVKVMDEAERRFNHRLNSHTRSVEDELKMYRDKLTRIAIFETELIDYIDKIKVKNE